MLKKKNQLALSNIEIKEDIKANLIDLNKNH